MTIDEGAATLSRLLPEFEPNLKWQVAVTDHDGQPVIYVAIRSKSDKTYGKLIEWDEAASDGAVARLAADLMLIARLTLEQEAEAE